MTPSSALATVLVDELRRNDIREVVLCPGSRSAPLAYAVLAAEREGRVRLHVRVDERSAGFLALGLAAASGRPVAVVTTSGTAVVNLHPAVLEAHHGGVPLVVVSADRPHELRGTGANQTTLQPGVFGDATRYAADIPAPVVRPGLPPFWRSTVCRAVAAARGWTSGSPGPVHLNVCLREPLVPDEDAPPWPDSLEGRPGGEPWVSTPLETRREPDASGPHVTAPRLADVERTLVVVGHARDPRVLERAVAWAAERGHPVVAEPFGPAAVRRAALPHGPLLLTASEWLEANLPDRVVVVGRPTLARPVVALLRHRGLRVDVVGEPGQWPDPSHVAAAVHGPDAMAGQRGGSGEHPDATGGAWATAWRAASESIADAVSRQPFPWPSGLAIAATVAAALPDDALLVVGSSNPVRDLDLAAPGAVGGEVLANRGLAGIDGLVSTAVGAALARPHHPVYALLGDLTAVHDSNGLLIGPGEPVPDLTLVVVNDDGGGIFTTLEPGAPEHAAHFERVFGTPTGTDLAALCRAHGVGHEVAATSADLADAVRRRPHGIRLVEVTVDRTGHRRAHADLRALAARAVEA